MEREREREREREVVLKNGTKTQEIIVRTTYITLEGLMTGKLGKGMQGAIALYDLLEKCKDSRYKYFQGNQEFLAGLALINADGTPHTDIKNIVLSAVIGSDLDMRLTNPRDLTATDRLHSRASSAPEGASAGK